MIVDCHTRIWASPEEMGSGSAGWLERNSGQPNLSADPADHAAATEGVDAVLVWGFRSRHLDAEIPNTFIADYAAQHRDRIVGVAAVDPLAPDAIERLTNVAERPEFAAVTVCPAGQAFHPAHSRAWRVYELCAERKIPVFFECGVDLAPSAAMEFARPALLDEIARALPELTMVVGDMGRPWVDEAVALLTRHANVYAEIASLLRRPWEAYRALLAAHERRAGEKLLFGSDFPFSTAPAAIEQLYRINEITRGTGLPAVPREVLRGIVERDALDALGIAPS